MARAPLLGRITALVTMTSAPVVAQVATTPGAVTTPYPTMQSIAIDWAITGDTNNNGVVTVRYRRAGSTAWTNAMALFRVPAGQNTTGSFGSGNGQWSNRHSGSLFNLVPATSYEIELTLNDPDGGSTTQTVTAETRWIPAAATNATLKPVTPTNFAATLSAAKAGDLLLLGAGTYPSFTVTKSGAMFSPIVIRGESVDAVTIQGRVTMNDQQYVHLENLTIQGEVRMHGASNTVVSGCRIRTTAGGITFEIGKDIPRNNLIIDNDVVGAANWVDSELSADGYDGGEGIQFTGSGHVVCFNHVKGFRDNISLMEYDEAYEQVSIDICNNDLEEATDDAIEADSAMGNVRVMRNQIRNCFDGVSSQPGLGGPTYFIRNTMYNVLYSPFKFHNGTVGDVVLHNSVVKCGDAFACYAGATWSRAWFRNNLLIGGTGGGTYGGYANGNGRVLNLADADNSCSFDYDGLGSIGTNLFSGRVGSATFDSLTTLRSNTTEQHAVQVDLSVFSSAVSFPSNPYPPKSNADLRLAAGSAAVDKGLVIAGLNEDFSGAAPDLGAYELGAQLPSYGPRVAGAGGAAGAGGTTSASGAPGAGGTTSASGAPGAGGTTSAAGSRSSGGAGTSSGIAGSGAALATGGGASGGTGMVVGSNAGGTVIGSSVGGAATTGGTATAVSGSGGTDYVAGSGGTGEVGLAGATATSGKPDKSSQGGCDCRLAAQSRPSTPALLCLLGLLWRRRRK